MTIQEIMVSSGGFLLIMMTLVQIVPLKVNPWSAVGRVIGKVINGDVLKELEEVKAQQRRTQEDLEKHVRVDDERNADLHRARILQFNRELLRESGPSHTEEDFNEILYNIKCYEHYCESHPEYQNNRAVHAIKNIERVYDRLMECHGFL